jgi:cytochrome c oxidase cbb3-type subunit II
MSETKRSFVENLDMSALLTVIGVILLFSMSVMVILIAPTYVDPTWTQPTSSYQVQMYEVSDPNFYIGTTYKGSQNLQAVYHLKENFTLLAFQESETVRITAPPELERYVSKLNDTPLKLTSKLLMLRIPQPAAEKTSYDAVVEADKIRKDFKAQWEKQRSNKSSENPENPVYSDFEVLELYIPQGKEAFAVAPVDAALENWVDKNNFVYLNNDIQPTYDILQGTIYISNPREYRIKRFRFGEAVSWRYDPEGEPIKNYQALKSHPLTFRSRQELIRAGEHTFAVEGCWYCHTDQTRTLVQDVVLNGSASYPAPPSSANEYIYQNITFAGTKRNGPDLSRVGIKRPSRDWHRGHFWSPKTASLGSIMPAFRHFFDYDPRGTAPSADIPNYKFEEIFQYLMTKGTRITPPTQAWWLGKDPIDTKAIIEGKKQN